MANYFQNLHRKKSGKKKVDLRQSHNKFMAAFVRRQQQVTGDNMTRDEIWKLERRAFERWRKLPGHMLSASDLSHHFQRYNSFRQQQLAWGEVEDRLFIDAFTRLPNLISASNRGYPDRYTWNADLKPPWRSLRRKILVGPCDWVLMTRRSVEDEGQKPLIMRHALCLMKALSHRTKLLDVSHVVNLSLANTGIQSFFDQTGLADTGSPRAQVFQMHRFDHLVFLELYVSYCFDLGPSHSAASLGSEVQSILQAARNLRHLRLQLMDVDAFDLHYDVDNLSKKLDFLSHLTPPQLPVLHTLELTCMTSEELLIGFLQTYAGSLRNLRLVDCKMSEDSTWQSFIRELPNVLNLEEVYFESLYKYDPGNWPVATFFDPSPYHNVLRKTEFSEHHKAVYDYVLGNSGELPLLKECCTPCPI